MMTFYFAPGSSSMAPHVMLHEVGADFVSRPLSFARKEQRQPAYLAINPEGKAPALVIDGRTLTEVAGILYYLARVFPAAGLLPEAPEAAAQVVSWMSFVASTIHPSRRRGVDAWKETWAIAERHLGGREWAVGRYSIADIHLFRLFWRLARSHDDMARGFPGLYAHHARMMARPAVRKTIEIEAAIGYELPE